MSESMRYVIVQLKTPFKGVSVFWKTNLVFHGGSAHHQTHLENNKDKMGSLILRLNGKRLIRAKATVNEQKHTDPSRILTNSELGSRLAQACSSSSFNCSIIILRRKRRAFDI